MAKENLSSAGEPDFDCCRLSRGDTYSLSSVNFFMGRILSKISPGVSTRSGVCWTL